MHGLAPPKKRASRLKAWIVFLDETGMLMAPLVRRSWAPAGQTPILFQRTRSHKKVSVIAALCVAPKRDRVRLYFRLHQDANIRTPHVCDFLGQLSRQLGEPIVLIWDRLQAHRSKRTQAFLDRHREIHTAFLPPYAPELNPVEGLWSYLKMNPMANVALFDVDSLALTARRHARSVQRKERLLRAFFRHCGLSLCIR